MIVTLTTLYTARVVQTDDKVFANAYRNTQALDAARTGFDYALANLIANTSTVTTGLASCTPVTNTFSLAAPGPLSNSATYTMTYGCVTAGSTTYLTITAVGTSADGSATKTVTATVKSLDSTIYAPVITQANATLTGTAALPTTITNSIAGQLYSVVAGGATISPSASGSNVTYSPNLTSASNSTLAGLSTASALETSFLGRTVASFASVSATNSIKLTSCPGLTIVTGATAFNSLGCTCAATGSVACTNTFNNVAASAVNGVLIYFGMGTNPFILTDSTAVYTVGTAASPVLLVINTTSAASPAVQLNAITNNRVSSFIGDIYTNGNLVLGRTAGNNNTGWSMNSTTAAPSTAVYSGLAFSSASLRLVQSGGNVSRVFLFGEAVSGTGSGAVNAVNSATVTLNSIPTAYQSLIGGGVGGGSGGYGLVSGSLKDF